ncbi:hypothetical protein CK203_040860 [Vitis vinifera]|uniref:Uncharacterized protein n=1 Tax=Vitis vinifera TaxID=29760 RepID=A0A438H4X6_VITVI|nr:hypothetical protein CK203_040860 [Vitis vinifera]
MPMAFSSNPLSLSVPDAAFETWLRDTGYLEVVDRRTSDLHRLSSGGDSSSTTASIPSNSFFLSQSCPTSEPYSPSSLSTPSPSSPPMTSPAHPLLDPRFRGFLRLLFLSVVVVPGSPKGPRERQALCSELRDSVHYLLRLFIENLGKRKEMVGLNLVFIVVLVFKEREVEKNEVSDAHCSSWVDFKFGTLDLLRFCSDKWRVDRYPVVRQALIHTVQCAHSNFKANN